MGPVRKTRITVGIVAIASIIGCGETRLPSSIADTPKLSALKTAAPRGTRIAFMSERDGDPELYIMAPDGSNLTQVTFDNGEGQFDPSWSPDGRQLAFEGGNADIWVINADGTGLRQVTNTPNAVDFYPAWSPDGRRIAFESDRDGNPEIYVVNVDGSNVVRLTYDEQADDLRPSWSPDGRYIVYDHDGRITLMRADGSDQRELTSEGYSAAPDFSPDGRYIVYMGLRSVAVEFEIYVIDLNGGAERRLTYNAVWDGFPSWSQDGKKIAFTSDRDGYRDIYIMSVDGNNVTRLTNDAAVDATPVWWP